MHRFLRFSAFCLAAWPAGAIAEEWWWQWEDSPSGVFRDFRPLLLGGTLLPLEPGSSVPAMAGPAISSPGGGAPARALKPARSSSQESPAVRPPAGPVGRSNPGPVSNLGGGTPVAGGMEMAARSPSAYQGMGVADGFYAAGSGRVGFSSGNGMVWQLLVPWYGYLIISPGYVIWLSAHQL